MSLVGGNPRLGGPLLNVAQENFVNQGYLSAVLDAIFPNQKKVNESRRSAGLKDPGTRNALELDIWYPTLNICFEFQDPYHYEPTWYFQFSLEKIQQRDNFKKEQAQRKGITLVAVPCWWDGRQESLVASIRFYRPDLLEGFIGSQIIPLTPPFSQFAYENVPDVGTLMLASFPASSNVFINTDFWWIGEKYDGMRCCWNPTKRVVYSRSGRRISFDVAFTNHLPKMFMDSECWFGRGEYQQIMRLVNGDPNFVHWQSLRFVAFDNPSCEGEFEKRYAKLLTSVPFDSPFVIVISRTLCSSIRKLTYLIDQIMEGGGEGVILRMPLSPYAPGRSTFLLKLKAARTDEEALVIGESKNKSIRLKLPNGQTFLVPNENVPKSRPKVGDVVTFCYDSFSRQSLPVNPKITRVRIDVPWDDIAPKLDNADVKRFNSKPVGYWTRANMRFLFESIAKNRNLDPLVPETWYSIPGRILKQTMGVATILNKLKGSYYDKLHFLFPDVKLDPYKISSKFYWHELRHRRKYFENFAKEHNFDPLNPSNWYSLSKQNVKALKSNNVIVHYNNSIAQALLSLFPNIGLDESKFLYLSDTMQYISNSKEFYENIRNRKMLFENFARVHKFDPNDPHIWYSQSFALIWGFKGARHVLSYYDKSIPRALQDLFPNLDIDPSMFKKDWTNLQKRRHFFENFAGKHGYDPFVAEHWYLVSREQIIKTFGARAVISFYGGSVIKALLDLFPDIGINISKFSYTEGIVEDRKFFENFAVSHKFDPLIVENWYSRSLVGIWKSKGASQVLRNHNNDVIIALQNVFPEISFESSKFHNPHKGSMQNIEERRDFFLNFAKENNFDAFHPENWYAQSLASIRNSKGGSSVLSYHENRVSKALQDLFPTIRFDLSKFYGEKNR
eukprot:Phypoly_transcript_01954.p1 GENE.Phypoly_transcript_01954~~Phypoly_transcript_01954.p1  ORF type:complete len:900 (+),score=97.26 Phypoly_transcript_01954:131-2830(+)